MLHISSYLFYLLPLKVLCHIFSLLQKGKIKVVRKTVSDRSKSQVFTFALQENKFQVSNEQHHQKLSGVGSSARVIHAGYCSQERLQGVAGA
jgi:hypothetical protein